MKKFLVVLFALSMVGACGGGGGSEDNGNAGPSASGSSADDVSSSGGTESTEVYDYYKNDQYVVYVDTSLYFGDYDRDPAWDTLSNNVFSYTLSNILSVSAITNNTMMFQLDGVPIFYYLDEDYPHFDGQDELEYWRIDGNNMCLLSLHSLPNSSGYTDKITLVCDDVYYKTMGFVTYERANTSAIKSFATKSTDDEDDSVIQEAMDDAINDLEERRIDTSR